MFITPIVIRVVTSAGNLCMQASQAEQPLPSCILCRMPISDVPRYGRPLKRRALELAERKFVGICGNDLEAALADGVAIKQASHSLLLGAWQAVDFNQWCVAWSVLKTNVLHWVRA
jgi:hypothetical protein